MKGIILRILVGFLFPVSLWHKNLLIPRKSAIIKFNNWKKAFHGD